MVRSGAEYRAVADAGRTRAAAGNLVANFLLLKSDGPISGFAKNGDAIVVTNNNQAIDAQNHLLFKVGKTARYGNRVVYE